MHRSRIQLILIDHPADTATSGGRFWAQAVGQRPDAAPSASSEYTVLGDLGNGIALVHQRIGDSEPRVHIDIETDDVDAEVARLERLGATRGTQMQGFWQMHDPAGLVFCVVPVQTDDFPAHTAEWP